MNLSLPSKKMIMVIGISAVVIIAAGIAFFRSLQALFFAFGVILTSSLNVLKVVMLERTVNKISDMDEADAGKNYVRLQYLARYFLTAVVLLGVGLITMYVDPPFINIWGAVAGVFTLQIAVFSVKFMKLEEKDSE